MCEGKLRHYTNYNAYENYNEGKIIAFPVTFGGEPKSNAEIKKFAQEKYVFRNLDEHR